MRILITGATGFIGRQIAGALIAAGHSLRCAVRDTRRARRMFPRQDVVACNFNRDVTPEVWRTRLEGIDAVVNCAGILQSRGRQKMAAIHDAAPKALFEACAGTGVGRVVHISALGVGPDLPVEYSRTKLAAEQHLQDLDLDWVILRPSMVYSTAGSFGGSSLFRGLASLPWFIPLVGDGGQLFAPIHATDLARGVCNLLSDRRASRRVLAAVGPEPMPMRDILAALRNWLGFGRALFLRVPLGAIRWMAKVSDWFGGRGPITSTSLAMLLAGNAAPPEPFADAVGFKPRSLADALESEPAHVQDRWHARLYFLRPLLRITIAFFWLYTGIVTFLFWPKDSAFFLLRSAHVPAELLPYAYYLGYALDVVLGLLLLMRWWVRTVGAIMVAVTAFYLVFVTLAAPAEWIYPITPLPIVFVLMAATLVVMAIDRER
jgi:uncharacterized protein YbjT (DUF2867 family)